MDFVADIAGRCCESGDIIQPNVTIQKAAPEDILAVCVTGAYNYSMASNYNRLPRPALVLVKDGKSKVLLFFSTASRERISAEKNITAP